MMMNQNIQVLDVVALTEDIPYAVSCVDKWERWSTRMLPGLLKWNSRTMRAKPTRCFHSNPANSSCCTISLRDAL